MKFTFQALIGLVSLATIIQCSGGSGLPRPGRGTYCKANENPLPLKVKKARKLAMNKVGKQNGGLPPGTYVYHKMEAYFQLELPKKDPNSPRPNLLARHIAHQPKGNGEWDFEGKCFRAPKTIKFTVPGIAVATQVTVESADDSRGQIAVQELKSFSFGDNGDELFFDGPNDLQNDSYSLEDIYRLENGEGYFYEKSSTNDGDAPFEVRYRYPEILEFKNSKVQLFVMVQYNYYEPGAEVPDEKLLP